MSSNSVILQIEGLKKTYLTPEGQRIPILNIPQFTLRQGEQIALMGKSGGGKTTLLNIIAGITTADAGSVCIGGINIQALPEAARDRFRAERVGYVFQTFHLLPAFTALENVLLGMSFVGRKADRQRAIELLQRVGLGHRLHHRPHQLSVGEQQRVSVARALVKTPLLLLADEPTASIDRAHQQAVLDLLKQSCQEQQVALLLVTHAAEVAQQFDRVEHLDQINLATTEATKITENAHGVGH